MTQKKYFILKVMPVAIHFCTRLKRFFILLGSIDSSLTECQQWLTFTGTVQSVTG